jgi:hypothetical protein
VKKLKSAYARSSISKTLNNISPITDTDSLRRKNKLKKVHKNTKPPIPWLNGTEGFCVFGGIKMNSMFNA